MLNDTLNFQTKNQEKINNENFENLIAQVFRHRYEEQVYQISKLSTVHGKTLRHFFDNPTDNHTDIEVPLYDKLRFHEAKNVSYNFRASQYSKVLYIQIMAWNTDAYEVQTPV